MPLTNRLPRILSTHRLSCSKTGGCAISGACPNSISSSLRSLQHGNFFFPSSRLFHQFDARLSQNFSLGNFSLTSNVISQCYQSTQEHLPLDHAWNGLTPFSNLTKGISFSTRIPSSYVLISPQNFPPIRHAPRSR